MYGIIYSGVRPGIHTVREHGGVMLMSHVCVSQQEIDLFSTNNVQTNNSFNL